MNRVVWVTLCVASVAGHFSKEVRTLQSFRVTQPPGIDGKLDDRAWENAVRTGQFRTLGGKALSKAKTEVMTCWDTENLYIAFICYEPQMEKLVPSYKRYLGPYSWGAGTDEVELFIRKFRGKPGYFHFTASAAGQLYHRLSVAPRTDTEWRWHIKLRTARFKERWQVEMAIPFSELKYPLAGYHYALTPSDGEEWEITFGRFCVPVGEEWSSWNAGTFHSRGPLGKLIFRERSPQPVIDVPTAMINTIGKREMVLTVSNPTEKEHRIKVVGSLNRSRAKAQTVVPAGSSARLTLTWLIRKPGLCNQRLRIFSDGRLVKQGELLHKVEDLAMRLAEVVREVNHHSKDIARDKEIKQFVEEGEGLVRWWKSSKKGIKRLPPGIWEEKSRLTLSLLERSAGLLERAGKLSFRARMLRFWRKRLGAEPDYGACVEDNLTKIRRGEAFGGEITDTLRISLARNEYEGVQLVLCPFRKELKGVRIEVSGLEGKEGEIPPRYIRVRPVGYVEVPPIAGVGDRPQKPGGEWPDPLLEVESFDCERDRLQPVWIDVYAPPEQRTGIYRGKIVVRPTNSHPLEMRLEVLVWNFALPKKNNLRIDYWFWSGPGSIELYYKKKFGLEDFRRYAEFMGSYRIPLWPWITHLWGHNLIKIYREKGGKFSFDFSDYDPYLKVAVENGMNVFHIPGPVRLYRGAIEVYDRATGEKKKKKLSQEEFDELWMQMLVAMVQHLKELEWFDHEVAVFYAFDETQPRGKKYERMKFIHTRVKKLLPDLPRTFAMNTLDVEAFKDYVEIFIPVIERIKPETIRQLKKKGYRVWWYTMGYPQWPDYFINQDSVDHRIIPWMNWKYGVEGILRWAVNRWGLFFTRKPWIKVTLSEDPKKRWPNSPWKVLKNSSTYLFYPGPDGAPWASIRMENHRDGVEDYEYLVILEQTIEKIERNMKKVPKKELAPARALLELPQELVRTRADYVRKPEILLEYRKRVAEAIENLQKFLHP